MEESKTILKTLVGSRAHKLENEDSDYDYRGVFVAPTDYVVDHTHSPDMTDWNEGDVDYTAWEVSKFFKMVVQCNPTALEVFKGPAERADKWGCKLRGLFDAVLDSKRIRDAHLGYASNQRSKLMKEGDFDRINKYASAYIRVLFNGYQLLKHGDFEIAIGEIDHDISDVVKAAKTGSLSRGEILDLALEWEDKLKKAYEEHEKLEQDLEKVDEFLVEVRKAHWL